MSKPSLPQAGTLIQQLLVDHPVLSHPQCPFTYHTQAGDPGVVVLTGDNASGKSLLLNMVGSRAYYTHGVEPLIVSMSARTQGGVFRALTYGAESSRATGEVSVGTALRAVGAMAGRLEGTGRTLVVLDEPDFGLAEGYAHAFGMKIAQRLAELPQDGRWSLLLASHSRELVRGLTEGLGRVPTFIHTGDALTLNQWLAPPVRRDAQALDEMLERARTQSRTYTQIKSELEQSQRPRRTSP